MATYKVTLTSEEHGIDETIDCINKNLVKKRGKFWITKLDQMLALNA